MQSPVTNPPAVVTLTERLEQTQALDGVVRLVQPLVDALLADPGRAALLQGMWLGHAVHPLLTDVPIGTWTSATVLDLVGGRQAQPAAKRLIGVGILAAVPTALTGWAEWGPLEPRDKRTGVVHAATNVTALALYTASWRARGKGRHLRGVVLGLAASGALGLGGYLGGHLVEARKVSSRHPAFADPPVV
ncbi:MAG: hypothetical protein QOK15_990 [Nocardioidaceae bacterium]|jgi:uncharacterized membrane protein|nr:hypothetical protein [Nocardioidaceae bacterium]